MDEKYCHVPFPIAIVIAIVIAIHHHHRRSDEHKYATVKQMHTASIKQMHTARDVCDTMSERCRRAGGGGGFETTSGEAVDLFASTTQDVQ